MIPAIGIMVGAYIVTRMISLVTRKADGSESNLTRIFAAITILVAVVSMGALISASADLSTLTRGGY